MKPKREQALNVDEALALEEGIRSEAEADDVSLDEAIEKVKREREQWRLRIQESRKSA